MTNRLATLNSRTGDSQAVPSKENDTVTRDAGGPATVPEPASLRLLYRPKEAAALLGISESTLYGLVRRGLLRGVYVLGSRRFHHADLMAFADSLTSAPPAVWRASGARRPKQGGAPLDKQRPSPSHPETLAA